MASIVKLGKGKQPPRSIDFTGLDGKRKRLRLGVVTRSDAETAKRMHLIDEHFEDDDVVAEAEALTRKLAKIPSPAIAYNKAAINNALQTAGMLSSFMFNVESMSAVHCTENGQWWWSKISELGFREFLKFREAPFQNSNQNDGD